MPRPVPSRRSAHLFSTYARVYIYVCLSLYKSIRAVLSPFVASIPHLSYSSTRRSLRFPLPTLPAFLAAACLLFDSTVFLLACHRRVDVRFLLSGRWQYVYVFSYLYEHAWNVLERVYIRRINEKSNDDRRCRMNRNELLSVCQRFTRHT